MVARSSLLLLGIALSTLACSKKAPEPQAAKASTPAPMSEAAKAAAAAIGADGKLDPNDPKHGTRRLMGLDSPVYVDGAQVAVLRAGELPPIKGTALEGTGFSYKIADYLAAIGVDVANVRSVHFHGNQDRIGSVEGTELRKDKNRFQFSFVAGDSGIPVQRWGATGLKNEFVVNDIRRISVYVKKPSPAIHPQRQCHLGADGDCTDTIPYANGELAKGTRIYVDGKMVGFVKRRAVTDAMLVGPALADTSENKYSLAKLVSGLGVDPTGIKAIEMVAGDDVIGRATGEQFNSLASKTTFSLPKHNHGKIKIHVPGELQAHDNDSAITDRDALVSAVLLYKNAAPTDRNLVVISEDTDLSVQLAAIDDARAKLGRGDQ